jgi:hypothetical protein
VDPPAAAAPPDPSAPEQPPVPDAAAEDIVDGPSATPADALVALQQRWAAFVVAAGLAALATTWCHLARLGEATSQLWAAADPTEPRSALPS